MNMQDNMNQKSSIIMYITEDGMAKIETTFDGDTVWLSIDQMAELFQRDKSVIGKHVRNIFKEDELLKESVWANFAQYALDNFSSLEINLANEINVLNPISTSRIITYKFDKTVAKVVR